MIDETTNQFLISEYEKSFDMIFEIDNRRAKFLTTLYTAFVTTISAIIALIIITIDKYKYDTNIQFIVGVFSIFLLLFMIAISYSTRKQILIEREANIRYRNKINLIRECKLMEYEKGTSLSTFLHPENRRRYGHQFFRDGSPSKNVKGEMIPAILFPIHCIMITCAICIFGLMIFIIIKSGFMVFIINTMCTC